MAKIKVKNPVVELDGDEILGFVTRGQGVSVHRTDCPNAKGLAREPERLIEVSWRTGRPTSFVVTIQVDALDRTRLLSDVATALSDHHVNIISAASTVIWSLVSSRFWTLRS